MVWYMQCSWCENVGSWFSISLSVAQVTWFGMPDVSSAKGEWVEHGIKGHEILEGNNIGGP